MTVPRLFGIKIHGGNTSEARVFATLLAHRGHHYEAAVAYHEWPGDRASAAAFETQAALPVQRFDAGWRPNTGGPRGLRGPLAKVAALARFRASFPGLLAAARRYQPQAVYSSQQPWDCWAASYVARRLRKPHVIHLHFNVGPWLRTGFSSNPHLFSLATAALRLPNPLDRLVTCEHVVAISDFIRDQVLDLGAAPERVTTVRNSLALLPPVDDATRTAVRRDLGLPPDSQVIGIVGRLDPDKGHADVVTAFGQVAREYPHARLVLVGSGPLAEALRRRTAELGVDQRAVFTGFRADVPQLLGAMDVFAHPSRREPFGLAIAEASAAGLPVVAYDEGGVPEIVVHEQTGLLAPPGDVDAVAQSLKRLLDDPALARRLGEAGRTRVARALRPEDAAAAFAAVLRRVAA